jgi:DNA polymerase
MRNLERAAAGCRGCPLYRHATQTVFGSGLLKSRLMLVGEMPGNEEDLQGEPFVGPAGRILDRALEEAGIDRREAYVTNVVKHFKWEERGKRRLHKTPYAKEINACRPWLDKELELVQPDVLVALGATAARALLGTGFRVSRQHGQFVDSDLAPYVTATLHPSAVLRKQTDRERRQELRLLVQDLRKVERALNGRH